MTTTIKAVKKRELIGRMTDMELLHYLEVNPGKTLYEIAKALNWSTGKVQGSLRRLEDDLRVEVVEEGGRLKKRYYVKKIEDFLDMENL